jgi:hypothetical protein
VNLISVKNKTASFSSLKKGGSEENFKEGSQCITIGAQRSQQQGWETHALLLRST